MKCIIVIRGLASEDYLNLRNDLRTQFLDRGLEYTELPLFASLPTLEGESAGIEIVWIDPAMELEHLKLINSNIQTRATATSEDYAILYDALRATNI